MRLWDSWMWAVKQPSTWLAGRCSSVYKPVAASQPACEALADSELKAALLLSLRDLRIYGGGPSSARLDREEGSECVICLSAPVASGLLLKQQDSSAPA